MKYLMFLLALFNISCSNDKVTSSMFLDSNGKVSLSIDIDDDVHIHQINSLIKEIGYDISDYEFNSPFSKSKTKIINLSIEPKDYNKVTSKLLNSTIVNSVENNIKIKMIDDHDSILHKEYLTNKNHNFPNDPLYSNQWNMHMLDMDKAWEKSKGKGVIVAVIDTGVSDGLGKYAVVPDLEPTCILPGYNFIDNNNDAYDDDGHGTHVSGTIAQATNNNFGAVGIAPEACILPVKVLDSDGRGSWADIAEGIIWAVDNGAHVINLSLGAALSSLIVEKAIAYAYEKNVFLSCAAGNDKKNKIIYPAGYKGCHAISALNKKGDLAWYSNYGKSEHGESIFLAAPGGDTRSNIKNGIVQNTISMDNPEEHGFFYYQGTSMAAPHVAGVAALITSKIGVKNIDVEIIEEVLSNSTKHKFNKNKYGYGQLNAGMAMDYIEDNFDFESKVFDNIIVTLFFVVFLYGIPLVYPRKKKNV